MVVGLNECSLQSRGLRKTRDVKTRLSTGKGCPGVALTAFQRDVCQLLAKRRLESGDSYVAGGAALNAVPPKNMGHRR